MQKPNLVIALCLFLLLLGATFAVSRNGAYASESAGTKHISDDATGGHCTTIGSWDTATKTCTLNMNVGETIQIDNNGITLDGNGCMVTGSGMGIGDIGIYLPSGRTGVNIKNLYVQQFSYGIYLSYSSGNTLTGNTASNDGYGIRVNHSSGNTLTGNTASNNMVGVSLESSSSITLTGNTVDSSYDNGVSLYDSSGNTLTGNIVSNNAWGGGRYGIYLCYSSNNNEVYNNEFINNWAQAYACICSSSNVFNLAAPVGGNYWSDYDTAAEGCNDVSPADGFCDAPYIFPGGHDNLPRTPLTPAQAIQNLIGLVNGMNLPHGLTTNLNSKLQAAIDALNAGQNKDAKQLLNVFIKAVNTKCCDNPPSKPLTAAQALQLKTAAQDIIDSIPP